MLFNKKFIIFPILLLCLSSVNSVSNKIGNESISNESVIDEDDFYENSMSAYEQEYYEAKQKFVYEEAMLALSTKGPLKFNETKVNIILMKYKEKEIARPYGKLDNFLPAFNFLRISNQMKNRTMFQLLKKFPKAAVLNGHLEGMVSADYIIKNITYRDNLYVLLNSNGDIEQLEFREKSMKGSKISSNWVRMNETQKSKGSTYYEWINKQLFFYGNLSVDSTDLLVKRNLLSGLIRYEPVLRDYIYQMLKEYAEDNVSYLEFRADYLYPYYLNGTELNEKETWKLFREVINKFKSENPNFFGAKLIYRTDELINLSNLDSLLGRIKELENIYPNFLAGVDIGREYDVNFLYKISHKTNMYVEAEVTNFNGEDERRFLMDAVLLGAKRIARAYAIPKYPKVAYSIKKNKIGIEVCPISHQITGFVADLRNHPLGIMLRDSYPVVIVSDFPGFYGAKAVTYDWYETFIGIASESQDLTLLKKLALNSIEQSSLTEDEKDDLRQDWKRRLDDYYAAILEQYPENMKIPNTKEI